MKDNLIFDSYKVSNGDTIYNISKKFNVNPELLSLINGLNLSDYIYENQIILIPKKNYSYYLTKSGDNLLDVINLFKTNLIDFINTNNNILLEDGQLFVYKR